MTDRSLSSIEITVLVGGASVAASFAVAGATGNFPIAPLFAILIDLTPNVILSTVIVELGHIGEMIGVVATIGLLVLLYGLLGLGAVRISPRASLLAGLCAFALTVTLTGLGTTPIVAALTVTITSWALANSPTVVDIDPERRQVLKWGGLATFAGISYLFGSRVSTPDITAGQIDSEIPGQMQETAEQAAFDLPNSPGLVSSIDDHFTVDISAADPVISDDDWTLTITGDVEQEVEITYSDLRTMEADHRYITLRCVSDELNGRLMDTAIWTGVSLDTLLDKAGAEGSRVLFTAADGYTVDLPIDAVSDGLLAYGMNGQTLPREHGHPVRVLVPGHYGEANTKWVTEIEVINEDVDGYWEERGWEGGAGPVNMIAKLWTVEKDADGVLLGGHAYAGTRGISAVEVSTDGGETWSQAQLSPKLEGEDVWRQWRYRWDASPGSHEVLVRAVDENGNIQTRQRDGPKPDGSTGWVERTVEV